MTVNFNYSIKTFHHIYRYPCLIVHSSLFKMCISHDILYYVLDYLCDGHLLPLMGVNNLWRRMTLDRIEDLKTTSSSLNAVLLLIAECPKLKKLEVTFTGDEREQTLNSFVSLPSNIAELRCRGAIPEWWLASVCKRLPKLTAVDIIDNHTITGEFLIGAPLTSLQLTDCVGIAHSTIQKVLQGFEASGPWMTITGGCIKICLLL